uniref:Transmembrane protein n=1 Tax=Panagrellus redivivus TaxID=6233 RepID=A0A7E4UR89_PANRE
MSLFTSFFNYLTTLEFHQPKKEKLPFTKLPYAFKQRLAILAPCNVVKNFSRVYPTVEKYRGSDHPVTYIQLFITDDDDVLQWASKDTYFFRLFKFLCQFEFFQYIFDGPYTINPVWQSVMSLEDAIAMESDIYVEDTLVLYFNNLSSYAALSSFINGPYSRLVINNHLWWNYATPFIRKSVKQVRINAKSFFLPPGAYGSFIKFVEKHSCDYDSKLSFYHNDWHLKRGLADAFYPENTFTVQECRQTPDFIHVVHSKHTLRIILFKIGSLIVEVLYYFPPMAVLNHMYTLDLKAGNKVSETFVFPMCGLWFLIAIFYKLSKLFTVFYVPMDTMSGLKRFRDSRKCKILLGSDSTTHESHVLPGICIVFWWLFFRVTSGYFNP